MKIFDTRRRFTQVISLLLVIVFGSPAAFAQKESEEQMAFREMAAEKRVGMTAGKAAARRPFETKRKITYDQVMGDPDNIDLNYEFAQTQAAQGDLLGAASTLERILMIDPDLPRVRLFYAVVLYRLDNLTESERELNTLKPLQMPKSLRGELDAYLYRIKLRRKRTHITLRESYGFQNDTNRNAAPSSKQRLFGDTRVPIDPNDRQKNDVSWLNITSLDFRHDLGFQAGHEIVASFDYFRQDQIKARSLSMSNFQGEIGVALKSRFVNVTPSLVLNHMMLSHESFLRQAGGNLLIEKPLFKQRLNLYALGRVTRQNFLDIEENLASHTRKGPQLDATFGVSYNLTRILRVSAYYTYIDKLAKEKYYAYYGNVIGTGTSLLLGKGQFFLTNISYERDDYVAPDLAISSRHRRDRLFRLRLTYGVPLTTLYIGKFLPKPLNDLSVSVTYQYFRELSNITNYAYKNNTFQVMLSKTFEF